MTGIKFIAALFAALISAAPTLAQDDRGGIAFAYAAEQGSGHCVAGTPEKAMACARQKCVESGNALPQDCARVAWCFPAGWSVSIGVQHKEGIHWAEFSCGWPNREAAIAAGKVRCDHQDKAMIQNCHVGVVYDPTGKEIVLE
jgi:hypothetical protein